MIFGKTGIGNCFVGAVYLARVDQIKRLKPPSILTEGCKFSLEADLVICEQEEVPLYGEVSFNIVMYLFYLALQELGRTDSERQE